MRIALMGDIHANREAFEACLAHSRARAVDRWVFLGDYVGYGPEPRWVVATLMEMVASGAVAILGNHDAEIAETPAAGIPFANDDVEWTRRQLGAAGKSFLAGLPLAVEEEGRLYVHAEAAAPRRWTYVRDSETARRSLQATQSRLTFCGHVHQPALYTPSGIGMDAAGAGRVVRFRPIPDSPVPLAPHRRWLAVIGSVGQPRDGDPSAAYAVLDTLRFEITYHRVPYDVEAVAAKIHAAGLPASMAQRLREGT